MIIILYLFFEWQDVVKESWYLKKKYLMLFHYLLKLIKTVCKYTGCGNMTQKKSTRAVASLFEAQI
jgi:hypothetical protein